MRASGSSCLLLLLACAQPPSRAPTPPESPVLEGEPSVSLILKWTLRGSAPSGTVVRLYLDERCEGPSWRDVTPEDLSAGLEVDLAGGTLNVFTAISIDVQGVASSCSAPVRVRYSPPALPQRPSVSVLPTPPQRQTSYRIVGSAQDATTVRLFEGTTCSGEPLAVLSVAEFADPGFAIEATWPARSFVADAVNVLGQRSACTVWVTIWSDSTPPRITAELRSPSPSPQRKAFVWVADDAAEGWVYSGSLCGGDLLAHCTWQGCWAVAVEFPPGVEQWSAIAVDALGNRSFCVDSSWPWLFDASLGPPTVELTLSGSLLRGLVPGTHTSVSLFDGAGCADGQLRGQVAGEQLAGPGINPGGFFGPPDGGLISARGTDGLAVSPCSAPIVREY